MTDKHKPKPGFIKKLIMIGGPIKLTVTNRPERKASKGLNRETRGQFVFGSSTSD